jgi:AraC-like DNA-binding protein
LVWENKGRLVSRPIADTEVRLPAPSLRPFIARYAGFRVSGLPAGIHLGLPSSAVDLIISLGRPVEVVKMPRPTQQQPSTLTALVSGLQNSPAIVRQHGSAFGLHVFIKPLGVRAILGVSSAELTSLVLSFSDIWGKRAESLSDALFGAGTWQQRFAILDRAFASELNAAAPQSEISWSWERLARSHGSVPVDQLADEVGYSRRHFSERFRDAIGITPKSAARVFRFERACRLIAARRLSLAEVGLVCGYYDQAHLTREWHGLCGCSPKAWITRELPFLQDYELGGSENRSEVCD